jgi:PHP family Zn ribbon phosphoesterase
MRSERHQELNDLLRIMPELTAYNISLKPKTANYRYCRECRVFFNNPPSEGLGRCPICGGKLSGPRRKRVAKYVDPVEHLGIPWPHPRRQTTLGDFLSGLWRQMMLDELIRGMGR